MAFRYHINLVADRIERRKMRADLLRAITISLCALLVMLAATGAVYQVRNQQVLDDRRVTRLLADKIKRAGIRSEEVGALQQENQELVLLLEGIGKLVQSSEVWSSVLLDLEQCCRAGRVRIKKVQARENEQGTVVLHVIARSERQNPVADVYDFLAEARRHEKFQVGSLILVENEEGESIVHVQVPLTGTGPSVEEKPAESKT